MCVSNPHENVPCAVTIPALSKDSVSSTKDRKRSKVRGVTTSKRWSTRSGDPQISARSGSSARSVSQASTCSGDTTGRWKVLRDSPSDLESLNFGMRDSSSDLEEPAWTAEEEEKEQVELEQQQEEQHKEEDAQKEEEENGPMSATGSEVAVELQRSQMLAAREKRMLEEARRKREVVAKCQGQLEDFLSKHGFSCVNDRKKTKGRLGPLSSGYTYPLHAAVQAADLGAIRLLLWGGADRYVTDSSNRTALSLALKLDKNGSHAALMEILAD